MALHYNLAKVYALSNDEDAFVQEKIQYFVFEIPKLIENLKETIDEKNYKSVAESAAKINPYLDLMGMNAAFEEIILVQKWSLSSGKRKEIIDTYKSLNNAIKLAIKEIKKDFHLDVKIKK